MPVVLPGLIGTTDDATLAGMGTTPAATSLIASADGLEWQAVARFDGVALEALIEVGPGEFLVSGAEVARNSEGYPRVTGRGNWTIALTDPLGTIIQTSR